MNRPLLGVSFMTLFMGCCHILYAKDYLDSFPTIPTSMVMSTIVSVLFGCIFHKPKYRKAVLIVAIIAVFILSACFFYSGSFVDLFVFLICLSIVTDVSRLAYEGYEEY